MTMDENMGNGRILMGKSSTNRQFETMIDGENMGKFRDVPLPGDMPLGGFIKAVAARMTGQRSPSPSPKRCVDDFPRGAHAAHGSRMCKIWFFPCCFPWLTLRLSPILG